MIPLGRSEVVTINGDAYTLHEPSALCSAELLDAQAADVSSIHLAAITVFHCVSGFPGDAPESPDEILAKMPAHLLLALSNAVINAFPLDGEAGNSEAGPRAVLS